MHGDLSPNLHTPECNLIIKQYQECLAQNPVGKFLGSCNTIDNLLVNCLRKERQSNQSENFKKSAERQKKFRERVASANTQTNSQ